MVKWRELELLVAADRCASVCTTQSPILFYIRHIFSLENIFHGDSNPSILDKNRKFKNYVINQLYACL